MESQDAAHTRPGPAGRFRTVDSMSTDLTLQDLESNTRAENRLIRGRLIVSTNRRDLVWRLNGDDAMRVMKVFASQGSHSAWGDQIDPLTSEAMYGWFAWRDTKVVAMRWEPDCDATSEAIAKAVLDAGPEALTAMALLAKVTSKGPETTDRDIGKGRDDAPDDSLVHEDSEATVDIPAEADNDSIPQDDVPRDDDRR